MTTITLAGNFIDLTDYAVPDQNSETLGWGHLQLVKDGKEIEVQAPIDFWTESVTAGLQAGPLGLTAGAFVGYVLGNWQFPLAGESG